MHFFELIPTAKTLAWLKKNKICLPSLQSALNMLYCEISPTKNFKLTKLVLQVDYIHDSSAYYFGTNKIYLCSDPDLLAKSRKQKNFVIFLHFLHEFRHWMQSQVFGIKDKQLLYTEDDYKKNSKKYWNDKFEVDARRFEKKHIRRFMKYYVLFRKSYR